MLLHKKRQPVPLLLALSALALLLVACLPAGRSSVAAAAPVAEAAATVSTERPVTEEPTATPYPTPVPDSLRHSPESCLVTRLPQPRFIPPEPWPERPPDDRQFWYGDDALWTMLPGDGAWAQLARGEKVWWWSEGFDGSVEGQPELGVTARRLDGPAPEARRDPPATNGYHPSFHWAILTGFQVPTPGCWEITGRYRGRELTFVVWVPPG